MARGLESIGGGRLASALGDGITAGGPPAPAPVPQIDLGALEALKSGERDSRKSSARDSLKANPSQVLYHDSTQHCEGCEYFEAPSGCEKVSGAIDAGGWCVLYTQGGEADEELAEGPEDSSGEEAAERGTGAAGAAGGGAGGIA